MDTDECNHEGDIIARKCHGYLNDKPAGTIEYLCADCGSEVEK